MNSHPSWGFYPIVSSEKYTELSHRYEKIPFGENSILPRGLGRSYGDSCLNDGGLLLGSNQLNNFINFDHNTGILKCESGVSLDEILTFAVPRGWFLPVTPGTKFVSIGGAIANDVHGKNHHSAGNWGNHILSFELLRSTGERIICTKTLNPGFFHATIGGLGLTGFITWAEFQLKKIASSWINQEQIQFHTLNEFFALSAASESKFEYTVAWVDCLGSKNQQKGIFIRGNHCENHMVDLSIHKHTETKKIPFFLPEWSLNPLSIRLFNKTYFHKNLTSFKSNRCHYDPFFYPLDTIGNWNRIYGRRGFLQYQFVIPYKDDNGAALKEIFDLIKKSNMGSFLAVLKTFGSVPSQGLLSFPREGVTLALDFPNYGGDLLTLLENCDAIVKQVGGRVYPAKDARMSRECFAAFYPEVNTFKRYLDPAMSSSFWRRIT